MDRRIQACLLAFLVIAGAAARLLHEGDLRDRTPDERTYTANAKVIADEGFRGVRRLVVQHNATPAEWIYPEPTRVGYLWPVAWTIELTGYRDERAGSWLSWFCSVLSLGLVAWAGWRFFNPWIAAVALLLADFGVPDLVLARRAWQDSAMELIGLAMAYCACEALLSQKRLAWLAALSAIGGYSLLVKDSSPGVFGFWVLWLAGALTVREKNWRDVTRLTALATSATAAALIALVALCGGFRPLLDVYVLTGRAIGTNPYAVEYQSGSWIRFFSAFFTLSPVTTCLFLVGAVAAVRREQPVLAGLAIFPLFLLASALVVPHSQNVRYLSPVYGPVYLVAAYGFWWTIQLARQLLNTTAFRVASATLIAALLIAAAQDWRDFERIFVANETADLSVKMIADSTGTLP
jgi:hypothetical protein